MESLTGGTYASVGPTCHRDRNRAGGAILRTWPELVAGEFSGEITGTIVIYYSRRVEWSRW